VAQSRADLTLVLFGISVYFS